MKRKFIILRILISNSYLTPDQLTILTDWELNILCENRKDKRKTMLLYKILTKNIITCSDHKLFLVENIIRCQNIEICELIYNTSNNIIILSSTIFCTMIRSIINCNNVKIARRIVNICYTRSITSHKYCNYIILSLSGVTNINIMNLIIKCLSNRSFLMSSNFLNIFNSILKIDDEETLKIVVKLIDSNVNDLEKKISYFEMCSIEEAKLLYNEITKGKTKPFTYKLTNAQSFNDSSQIIPFVKRKKIFN